MSLLSGFSTEAPKHTDKSEIKDKTELIIEKIGDLQNTLYGERKHSILLILQGMDGSGKDGIARKLFRYCSPAGIRFYAFKKPTEEEFAHDFLWRVHSHMPEKGFIQIFNRSHYEDVLIQRVHGWIDEERAQKRIQSINAFEELISYDNNTTVLKYYLHISHDRQIEKLQERIDDPKKNWKHNPGDWEETKLWDKYMNCYEDLFRRCTIPWQIIPCDDEWYRDYVAAKKLLETLESLQMKLPTLKDNPK